MHPFGHCKRGAKTAAKIESTDAAFPACCYKCLQIAHGDAIDRGRH